MSTLEQPAPPSPRSPLARRLDIVQARRDRVVSEYVWVRDGKLRSRWETDAAPIAVAELASKSTSLEVRRYARLFSWLKMLVAALVFLVVLGGLAVGGPWAIAAGVALGAGVVGGLIYAMTEFMGGF